MQIQRRKPCITRDSLVFATSIGSTSDWSNRSILHIEGKPRVQPTVWSCSTGCVRPRHCARPYVDRYPRAKWIPSVDKKAVNTVQYVNGSCSAGDYMRECIGTVCNRKLARSGLVFMRRLYVYMNSTSSKETILVAYMRTRQFRSSTTRLSMLFLRCYLEAKYFLEFLHKIMVFEKTMIYFAKRCLATLEKALF